MIQIITTIKRISHPQNERTIKDICNVEISRLVVFNVNPSTATRALISRLALGCVRLLLWIAAPLLSLTTTKREIEWLLTEDIQRHAG
jgi:hypothetical protein